MIKIREKELLFVVINFITFFAWAAHILDVGAIRALSEFTPSVPTISEGIAYIYYSEGSLCIAMVGVICLFVDLWWIWRLVKQYRKQYWRDNL